MYKRQLAGLSEWASVQPYYNPELGEEPGQKTYPAAFETVARDASLLTEFDRGHDLAAEGSTVAGEPRVPGCSAEEFFAQERSHTYLCLLYTSPRSTPRPSRRTPPRPSS